MGQEQAIVVFTAKSVERIVREGGTAAWRINRNHARQCSLVVCTRNAHADWVEGNESHRSAFLVGRLLDVVPCAATPENKESDQGRHLIRFSEYARVNIPDYWEGDRNPVVYRSVNDLSIDPTNLKWETMPEPLQREETENNSHAEFKDGVVRPLTLAEAKKGLALAFNVSPDAVEITIRG